MSNWEIVGLLIAAGFVAVAMLLLLVMAASVLSWLMQQWLYWRTRKVPLEVGQLWIGKLGNKEAVIDKDCYSGDPKFFIISDVTLNGRWFTKKDWDRERWFWRLHLYGHDPVSSRRKINRS